MYATSVQQAFRSIIKTIGTGPWGAGLWWGDSQMYFLTTWLATNLLQHVTLDYYIYDYFCENPGNQCFVLGRNGCGSCINTSGVIGPLASRCGQFTVEDTVAQFSGQT